MAPAAAARRRRTGVTVQVEYTSPDQFAATCAQVTARLIAVAQAERGWASVAFSGGSTVGPVFDELVTLAADPPSPDLVVDWGRVGVAQVDERVVDFDQPDRNGAVLVERLLDALPVRPAIVELLPVELVDPGGWLDAARAGLARPQVLGRASMWSSWASAPTATPHRWCPAIRCLRSGPTRSPSPGSIRDIGA